MEEVKDIVGDSSIAKHRERVIYVEPNDVYDFDTGNKEQGHMLTPKYEDFCIYFNLIIENYKRFKQNQINGESNNKSTTYAIRWGLSSEDLVKRRTSVLQGDRGYYTLDADGNPKYDVQDYNYLTTYYTDISTDSYYEKTEIEGLGVTSVDISYESWYTPTVTIKFVDVRGAALFGREEAIHVDEHLNADNVFGAFFSMPYPLFRLQVKGFFGKPVTYQLTCSNFKADFNSNTGNFEAVATFIGYSWSLLTDIPFSYLVAAPYAPYIGQEYWDRKVNSKEWGMWDNGNNTTPPIKLADLFQRIKNADSTIESQMALANDEETSQLSNYQTEITFLKDIKSNLNAFKGHLKRLADNKFIEGADADNKSDQLMLFSDVTSIEIDSEIKTTYDKFLNSLKSYTTSFPNDDINYEQRPNKLNGIVDLKLTEKFIITKKENSEEIEHIDVKDLYDITIESLMGLKLDSDISLNSNIANKLCDAILAENYSDTKICKYVYVVEFNNIMNAVEAQLNKLQKDCSDTNRQLNAKLNYNINSIIGFKPFIGNIFKLIFCHLETFCHIIFDSAAEIYKQKDEDKGRSPEKLGINITNTDINGNVCDFVTPWPAVFNKGKLTQEAGYESKFEDVYGWVGDFSDNFIEANVVYALQEGIQRISQRYSNKDAAEEINTFPITPVDMAYKPSPFASVEANSISNLAGYLAIRMANILGVVFDDTISEDFAKQLGVMDAYNYYSVNSDPTSLERNITQRTITNIKNIMYCNADGDEYAPNKVEGSDVVYHNFEIVKRVKTEYNSNGRKPMFLKQGDNNLFVQWYYKNDISFTPSRLYPFDEYNRSLFYYKQEEGIPYFIPYANVWSTDKVMVEDALYNANTIKLNEFADAKGDAQELVYTNISNSVVFNIITSEKHVKRILSIGERYGRDEFELNGYKFNLNLSDFTSRVLHIGTADYSAFFQSQGVITQSFRKSGVDEKMFLPKDFDFNADDTSSALKYFRKELNAEWIPFGGGKLAQYATLNGNGKVSLNNEELSDSEFAINNFLIYYNGEAGTLFGSPFYYMQNVIFNGEQKLTDTYIERVTKSKALLFLHTLPYNFKNVSISAFSTDKKNGTLQVVPKAYALLLGGLLWRERYYQIHSFDPIAFAADVTYSDGKEKRVEHYEYQSCPQEYTLFFLNAHNYYSLNTSEVNDRHKYNVSIESIFPNYTELDVTTKNKLIDLFDEFVKNEFTPLANKLEIKSNIQNIDVVEYDVATIINQIKKMARFAFGVTNDSFNKWFRENGIYNCFNYYKAIAVDVEQMKEGTKGPQLLMLLDDTNAEIQKTLKDLYLGKYIFVDSCHKLKTNTNDDVTDSDKIIIKNSLFDAYLNGFCETISSIVDKKGPKTQIDDNLYVSEETVQNRDLSISIYYFIKNLWDRWMVTSDSNAFDVSEFFMKNFVFIDSFYNNTYHLLAINCNKFLDAWTQLADKGSLFQFIGRIVSDHHCIFAPVPDYIGFNNPDQTEDIKTMENLFRPMPFDDIPLPSNSNKYIVMYAQDYSKMPTGDNGYVVDSFDIWSHSSKNDITDDAAKCFAATKEVDYDVENPIATKYGYNVPSFGVAFGRQNNHLFKAIKLGMDNPVVTEQAIKAQYEIMSLASGGGRKVNFIGQDTFNVFTNYSYSATVEMMGNAQICPFMYFQLLNVPMWRGTYMIYKVSHTMTPGDMTTTFTGMKMSKYSKPYNTTFFTYNAIDSNSGDVYNLSDSSSSYAGSSSSSSSRGGGGKTTIGALDFNVSDLTSNSISQYEFEVMQSQEKRFMGKYNKTNYNNAVKIANRLMDELGLSRCQAAGIVGCIIQESDCQPWAYNKSEAYEWGIPPNNQINPNDPGYKKNWYGAGICQWTTHKNGKWSMKIPALQAIGKTFTLKTVYNNDEARIEKYELETQITMLVQMCRNIDINGKKIDGIAGWKHSISVIKNAGNVIDACRVWALVEAGKGSETYKDVAGAIKATQSGSVRDKWDMTTIKVNGKDERRSLWMSCRLYYAKAFYDQWTKSNKGA